MARIVQDSDDELDEDLEADLPTSQSTRGTDRLNGESTETRHVRLQPLPSQHVPQSSVALPEHANKRRKTEPHLSPRRSSSPPMSNAPARFHPGEFTADHGLANLPEAVWDLQGTLRNDYAQHDPAMFGEPSSTIPNATMTQQRVLEAVRAPAMLGQEPETEGPAYVPPPGSSVPWSDIMKFTPAEAMEQAESSGREPPPVTSLGTPIPAVHKDPGLPASQPSRRASSLHPRESPLSDGCSYVDRNTVDSGPAAPKSDSQAISEISPAAPECRSNEPTNAKTSSHRHSSQLPPSSYDELTAIGLPEERYKPRPSRSRSLKTQLEEPTDYSIRPERAMKVSKRRRTTAEMRGAYAITTPEKVRQICAMGFTPSTTAGALKRNNGDVIQTVDWLVTNNIGHDELAPQSPPRPTLNKREAGVPPAVDAQTVQEIMRDLNEYRRDDDEIAQSAPIAAPDTDSTAAQTGYSHAAVTAPKSDLSLEAAQNMSPTKVQVVIPKKSPKAAAAKAEDTTSVSSKKTKRQKTTSDQSEAESLQAITNIPEVATEKKRGRGRPKKPAAIPETLESIEISEQEAKSEHPNEPLQTIESDPVTEKVESDSELAHEKSERISPVDPVSSKTTAQYNLPSKPSPAAALDTPGNSTKSIASPITKGKVPYRVGLSKRAKIAPLLRTLKK